MVSQTQNANPQLDIYPATGGMNSQMPGQGNQALLRGPNAARETAVRQVWAQGLEFVGLPGDPERFQREIPSVVQNAHAGSDGFIGCLVLFSEQENRLVTVITLWADGVWFEQPSGNSNGLKRLLEPYVDRWLRSSKFVTFLPCSIVPGKNR